MAINLTLKYATDILTLALDRGIPLAEAHRLENQLGSYVEAVRYSLPALLHNKEVTRKQANKFTALYEQLVAHPDRGASAPAPSPPVGRLANKAPATPPQRAAVTEDRATTALFADFAEDGLVGVKGVRAEAVRGADGLIARYAYRIPVPGKSYQLRGELSRAQMELLYSLYPYATIQQVSAHFPQLPTEDLRRITRAFRLTKNTKFPLHILEERDEQEAAEFATQAKVQRISDKLPDVELSALSKRNRRLAVDLNQVKYTNAWAQQLLQDVLRTYRPDLPKPTRVSAPDRFQLAGGSVTVGPRHTYTLFSDIHFGKFFPTRKIRYGRGNDKDILRERCLRIAEQTAREALANRSKHVHLICGGDIFESIIPAGMHAGHLHEMDLLGHEQLMLGVKVFEEMLATLTSNLAADVKLTLHGIGGNHDRVDPKREEDPARTATLIFYNFLDYVTQTRYAGQREVQIINYVDNDSIIRFAVDEEALSFIGHHGDAPIGKKSATDLLNGQRVGNADNYTILFQGHFHHLKPLAEGANYLHVQLGSVCAGDGYSQNKIGTGSQPSFLIGTRPATGAFGFDYQKFTLA